MSAEPVVHVVDDDASFLTAVKRLLQASGFRVQTFASGKELLTHLTPETRGCVVADLHMPELGGLQLQETLQSASVALPVVFLTGNGDIRSSVQAMRRGAVDFLEKDAPKEALLGAVKEALAKDAAAAALQERFRVLSGREREVLALVVRGKMNKEIAAALGIHERTVKLHRTSITTKLRVASVAELTVMTREAGLFSQTPVDFPKGQ